MRVFVIEFGNCYDGLEVYKEVYTDEALADKKILELEQKFDEELGADYEFRKQYGVYKTEVVLI